LNESWHLEQLSLVRQVSAEIVNLRDLDELSRRVVKLIQHSFNFYYTAIFTLEPGQDVLRFRASAGPVRSNDTPNEGASGEMRAPALAIRLGEGIIGHVALTGQELVANDVRLEASYLDEEMLPETRSEVTLPLKIEERVLGVLDIQSDQPQCFQETDMLTLRALAGNIAVAVEGARMYSALQRHTDHLATISEVSRAITSILDKDELFTKVVTLIQKRFGYPFVHLFAVQPEHHNIVYKAGSGSYSQEFLKGDLVYDIGDPEGIIPWIARHAETVLANDVELEPRYRSSGLSPDKTLSELAVPVIFDETVLGVLDVQSDHRYAFDDEDRFVFEALADNIAIAMRNAALYHSEQWRRQAADSLSEVAGLLSEDVDLDVILESALTELERLLPLDVAAIWLLDENTPADSLLDRPPLRLAAVHGMGSEALERYLGSSPEEIEQLYAQYELTGKPQPTSTWLEEAIGAGHPIVRTPQSPYEPLGAVLAFPPNYSAITAPLRVGEQELGVLTLAHRTPGRYGGGARALTTSFASYAAVAIGNARLYEAAYEQAWISTMLLQVSETLQSLTNLNDLLTTVIDFTPMLAGVKGGLLYLLDDDGTFMPAAASGLTTAQQTDFEHWRFAPGDVPALDQLITERQPVILSLDEDDASLYGIFYADEGDQHPPDSELFVLVPLMTHNEILGAFLIHYSSEPTGSQPGKGLEPFFDETLPVVQGIANQTATAVENVRLLKSQKEEAYLSVALLQVAQAVVSAQDLNEILGSIVRITPILVGVERAAIYLFDKASSTFHLGEAYGFPPAAEDVNTVTPAEFPLLDAVQKGDEVLAAPLSPAEEESSSVTEVWSRYDASNIKKTNELLESKDRLLIAFPLSVKEDFLGALLVEERHPAPVESHYSRDSIWQTREKRLEIITGISQQAAMAIQNDHLQHVMVERERLEREMQYAREIQKMFLPRRLPDLHGWDYEVLWRTARQVGGDFYDIFELPNKRLGVIIADVADKGMPAALFMSMIRSLVRETVQQFDDPAEVLEYVNEIILPDAQKGMFVTMVYGVLCLETGEFKYANAGHNLPLILRLRSDELEHLEGGGMALGVMDGFQIRGKTALLDHGDCLIMYTDGITEAFSPGGQIYGEDRLRTAIQDVRKHAPNEPEGTPNLAKIVLETIDQSVSSFINSDSLSDDQTLVVFSRQTPQE
jgi:serine phosphatase RsbU (regulator of sigma subunit)/putative methionine-R-sulfoxide reductase with GAF domain